MEKSITKITIILKSITMVLLLYLITINEATVLAEYTYTCSANNVSSFYCNFMTDDIQQQYGCTLNRDGSGCSGTCTRLTAEAIEKYGSYINVSMNTCTKNVIQTTSTIALTTTISNNTSGKDSSISTTIKTETNNTNISNPQTGTTLIVVTWIIGLAAIVFSVMYYKRIYGIQ